MLSRIENQGYLAINLIVLMVLYFLWQGYCSRGSEPSQASVACMMVLNYYFGPLFVLTMLMNLGWCFLSILRKNYSSRFGFNLSRGVMVLCVYLIFVLVIRS